MTLTIISNFASLVIHRVKLEYTSVAPKGQIFEDMVSCPSTVRNLKQCAMLATMINADNNGADEEYGEEGYSIDLETLAPGAS